MLDAGAPESSALECAITFEPYSREGPNQPRVLPSCGHTLCSTAVQNLLESGAHPVRCPLCRMQQRHLRHLNCAPPNWAIIQQLPVQTEHTENPAPPIASPTFPDDPLQMGECRINGRAHPINFRSVRHRYPAVGEGNVFISMQLPQELTNILVGIVHVQFRADVPLGPGSWAGIWDWGDAVEGVSMQLQGAPASAGIRYCADVGRSFKTGDPGFVTEFCSSGEFCGTRGQWRPLQSIAIDVVLP